MPPPRLSGFRIRQNEHLRLNFISSEAQIFDALCRIVYDDGSEDQLEIPQTTSLGDRSLEAAASKGQAKQNGTVTNAYVGIVTSGTKRGTFFAQLGLGPTLTTILCRGYVYTMRNLNLGEFGEPGPGGGEGFIRSQQIANPAAGVELSVTVPTNALWRFISLQARIVAGAVAFDPLLSFSDGTNVKVRTRTENIAATVGVNVNWSADPSNVGTGTERTVSVPPDLLLPEAYIIATGGITADDDYTVAELLVEEWLKF